MFSRRPTAARRSSRSSSNLPTGGPDFVYVVREDLEEQEPAVRRHRRRRVCLDQQGTELAEVHDRTADRAGDGPADPSARRRADRRDARAQFLDRRHRAAPAVDRADRRQAAASVRAENGVPVGRARVRRPVGRTETVRGAESAVRRGNRLPRHAADRPAGEGDRAGCAR